ncbi:MAG: glutaminyl-peptide cyclotransferase [Phycisphaerae bacterium]|nr:glutaminyl-peptide cyclotransferase [Phycisphaerae bacterium]
MKRLLIMSLLALLVCSCTETPAEQGPAVYGYRIVNTYPHQTSSFTQGLAFDNNQLYEGTGEYGYSHIFKIDLTTGRVLKRCCSLPNKQWGEGITILNNRLYQLTWKSRIGYVYDLDTFNVLRTFKYPSQGWGLTHNGTHLIMSDGSAALTFLDPNTLKPVRTLNVLNGQKPMTNLNELEYVQGRIYANIWLTEQIAIIDPETGQVEAIIDFTGLQDRHPQGDVLNGIAYNEKTDKLYITGKRWSELYEIELVKQ